MSVNGFIQGAVTVALSSALTTVPEGSQRISSGPTTTAREAASSGMVPASTPDSARNAWRISMASDRFRWGSVRRADMRGSRSTACTAPTEVLSTARPVLAPA